MCSAHASVNLDMSCTVHICCIYRTLAYKSFVTTTDKLYKHIRSYKTEILVYRGQSQQKRASWVRTTHLPVQWQDLILSGLLLFSCQTS